MEQNKKCIHCQKEIDINAKRCPHCHGDLRNFVNRHPIITVILIILAGCIIISIGESASKTADNSNSSTSIQTTPKTWHVVTTFSGNGEKQTAPFTIQGSEWRMDWQTTGQFNFALDADAADKGSEFCSAANIIGSGSDTSYCYQSGQFYLEANTGNQWTVKVEDYY